MAVLNCDAHSSETPLRLRSIKFCLELRMSKCYRLDYAREKASYNKVTYIIRDIKYVMRLIDSRHIFPR